MQSDYGPPQPAVPPWYPPAPAPPRQGDAGGRKLAVTALVLSVIALLGVLGAAVGFAGSGLYALSEPGGGGGNGWPLTGQLSASTAHDPVTGDALAKVISARLTQDFGDVSRMECPLTPKLGQGVVTVCHGVIDSLDYAVVVFFEDTDGHFTLLPT